MIQQVIEFEIIFTIKSGVYMNLYRPSPSLKSGRGFILYNYSGFPLPPPPPPLIYAYVLCYALSKFNWYLFAK